MGNEQTSMYSTSTRGFIITAFLNLLASTQFKKITVRQIVNKAGISRSTFYLHFENKYDLISEITEELVEGFLLFYSHPVVDTVESFNLSRDGISSNTLKICEHIKVNKSFYKDRFQDKEFIALFTERIGTELEKNLEDPEFAAFTAFGTVGYIAKWLENDLETNVHDFAKNLSTIGNTIMSRYATHS
ncbi:TetR family transcriptional regulator [Aquibacillus halophilus]|uniref:TetR family transcriptional regulator n=1 Tax=Aquibacillus halophilus TaxID=930132 RepID=A0A6A8DCV9_9BACI|nr:TetR/AcrR family transcriptional regulator [Aquibacillus halophilus]MRH41611.1 TetR family transcriptional regulator [Aquibacillus halophilus]